MKLDHARAAALMLGLSFVAGCSPVVAPTPIPSPTYHCVPEAGGDPLPCGPIEFEASQRRDAMYAEAEAVYRRYWAEVGRLRLSAEPVMTAELEATTEGTFRESVQTLLAQSQGAQLISGETPVSWVKRLPGLSRQGSVVALEVCSDSRGALFANPDGGDPRPGRAYQQRLYLGRSVGDASLRIVDSEFLQVESC